MKKILTLTLIVFLPLAPLQASNGLGPRERNAKETVDRMIHKLRGRINVAEYEMTVVRPSWTRALKMTVWDDRSRGRVFVRITGPAKEAGTSFLRLGYNLWNYLPSVEKVMKIPPSMMLQSWMGSDFTNDDLVKESSYVDDYEHDWAGEETVDGQTVKKIELTPRPNAPVVWGKVVFWVRQDDLPVRQHFIDERGRLVKDLVFSGFKPMDGVLLPTHWEMTPVLKTGHKTVLTLKSMDFEPSPPLPEAVFTEKNLRP